MRRTHKRAHSHFSIFTIAEERATDEECSNNISTARTGAAFFNEGVRRAKSSEVLSDPQELESRIEQELEERVQELRRKRYSQVTIPTAVKFSISGEAPNQQPELAFTMARPRSPTKKGAPSNYQDIFDQTIRSIRQQLSALSSERLQMEAQMEELTNGITEARNQCSRRYLNILPSTGTSLRRIHSHSEGKCHSVSPRFTKRNMAPRDEVDSPAQDSSEHGSTVSSSPADSPIQNHKESQTADISSCQGMDGGESPIGRSISESIRSDSISSAKSRGSSVHFRDASLTEVFVDEYSAIPELPESPRLDLVDLPCSPNQHRRASSVFAFKAVSTPDMTKRLEFSSLPPSLNKVHFSSSLPDNVLNQIVREDEVSLCFSESLSQSQSSSCAEEGSPRTGGIILRRSSLTGQLEHIRKPKKRIASFSSSSPPEKPRSGRYASAANLSRPTVRITPAKSNKSSKKRTTIILPGIETTV